MLYICYNQETNLLICKVHDTFTQADFEHSFLPEFIKISDRFDKVNLLIEFAHDFHGWELATLWREIQFSFEHLQAIKKIAIVGNNNLLRWSLRFFHPFTYLTINHFSLGQFEHALAWSTIDYH